MQAGTPAFNPLPLVVLVLAILGALSDWRYKRKGGKKPGRRAKIIFRTGLALVSALLVIMLMLAYRNPAATEKITESGAAAITGIGITLFGIWEFYRWMVRSKNPPSKPTAVAR